MPKESTKFKTLDVFTTVRYAGNPLAVIFVPSSDWLTQERKQLIAREFNLSESVFFHLVGQEVDGILEHRIDIFMTNAELPFAGHPVIGAAFECLAGAHDEKPAKVGDRKRLITKAGPIDIQVAQVEPYIRVQASIPHNVHTHSKVILDIGTSLNTAALSANHDIRECELTAPVASIVQGMSFLLVRLPNLEALGQLQLTTGWGLDGLDLTKLLDDGPWGVGFVGRYYFVKLEDGKNGLQRYRTRMLESTMEDPATGSAACTLCSYLATHLNDEGTVGTTRFELVQGVEMGRESIIGVEVDSKGKDVVGVRLSGSAVEVMSGELKI